MDGGVRLDSHGLGHWHAGRISHRVGIQSATVSQCRSLDATHCVAKSPSRQARRRQHREMSKPPPLPFVVAVTKMLSRKEACKIPEAMEAMKKEYARLAARC